MVARGREAGCALEVACGPGRHVRQLAAREVRSVGVDYNQKMLDYWEKRAAEKRLQPLEVD